MRSQLNNWATGLSYCEDKHNLPQMLSEDLVAFDYAPYSKLFPRSAAIVHQGGIGTTAQVLSSGRPMLIMPYSHEQPDNAARTKRLGVARTVERNLYSDLRAAVELRHLLGNPKDAQRAAEVGREIQAENGVRVACDRIEALLAQAS